MSDEKDPVEKLPEEVDAKKGNGQDEDINIELLDSEAQADADPVGDPASVDKQVDALRKEKQELYDRLLRKQADFENYRKRADKEKRDFQQYALADFMLDLVAILDNFDRALQHADEQSGSEYRKGVELINRQFRDLMEKRGLKAMVSEGQVFDPNFHEAILREENNNLPENTIVQELQKGYFFRDRLLRPAMVKVSFRNEGAADKTTPEDGDIEVIE